MADVVLPHAVNYTEQIPALPADAQQINISTNPVNNSSSYTAGTTVSFDLVNRGFLVPDSLFIRYQATYTGQSSTNATTDYSYIMGCPVYSPIATQSIQFGSQTVDTVNNYNVVAHMLSNTTLDIAQKFGMQPAFGYKDGLTAPTGDPATGDLDGRLLTNATDTFTVSAPLISVLANCEKLLPLFAMPQVRINLTLDALANFTGKIGATGTGATAYSLSNFELCYRVVDLGSQAEMAVRAMGDKVYIKSQSFSSSASPLPVGSQGTVELIYNQRYASVKSLFALFGCGNGANKNFDSFDVTKQNGEYSFTIAGVQYPQRPISTLLNKAGALQELRQALGSIFDRVNSMSISSVEFSMIDAASPLASTSFDPAKFYIGTNCEKLHSGSLLTGTSTQNSPVSLRISLGSATSQTYNVILVVNYDAIVEVDVVNRQANIRT